MNADTNLVVRLSILLLPLTVAAFSLASRKRSRLVPMAVFAMGLASIAGWRLLRHDWGAHESWLYFVGSTLLALPLLVAWQVYRVVREKAWTPLSMGDLCWLLASIATGIVGIWAAWEATSGIP
jgi:hypothetical protein